jgi:spore coat polysaccharide biosynthesis predicted glycosyltransferase SpsG
VNKIAFIRTDANVKIGYGHLSRCRILADELKKIGYGVVFFLGETEKYIKEEIGNRGFEYIELIRESADEMLDHMDRFDTTKKILIFDTDIKTYYDPEIQLIFIHRNIKIIHFTFWNQYYYHSHIIINQNPISLSQSYQTSDRTKKLLGPEYMIIDDNIVKLSRSERLESHSSALIFFLAFGGSDQPDRTRETLKALRRVSLPIEKINIVLGALYPNEHTLLEYMRDYNYPHKIYKQTNKIAEIMSESNIAICSGGLTLWELALFNIPTAIISYSEREFTTASYLHKTGLAHHIGSINHMHSKELSQKITNFVGNEEVRTRIAKLKKMINIEGKKLIAREIDNLNPE